jgi:RHS repeat-associated protein
MPIAELDSTGSVEKRYGPGYIVENDTTYRVIKDHLGSVRMVVNSQTGQVVQRIAYDAWGNITHLQNQDEFTDIGFAGGLYDTHTGLIRFGARDYSPETGRWSSKDPILFDGGTSNLYEYALNDPVNNRDFSGLQAVADSTSTYDRLSNSAYNTGLGAGTSSAMADQYQKHLGRRFGDYLSRFSSTPSARMLQSNMELLKMGKNLGGFVGAVCTASGAYFDSQNPNVSNARTSYRATVGSISTTVGYYNPLLGAAIGLGGAGLEYSYDNLLVPVANEFSRGGAAFENSYGRTWVPQY